jgi:hypothetical protein
MSDKKVYLMRGLPSCGKSYTARKLAGTGGVVCETDEYFFTQVGDDPTQYSYREDLLPEARRWNLQRFKEAVDSGRTPIVVDRGNGRNLETQVYARYALEHGYKVEIREPDSPWWLEVKALLKRKHLTKPLLQDWAQRLSEQSQLTHRVPAAVISHWMDGWKHDLTVEDILNYR